MKIDFKVYDDGTHLTVDDERRLERREVIQLRRPHPGVTLASVASAPRELGEISMVFEVPTFVMKERFRSPCDLQPNTRYPIKTGSSGHLFTGHFELEVDSIRFALHEAHGREQFSYTGRLTYKDSRGMIPTSLEIGQWIVFRGATAPEDGELSTFNTLGDLQRRLRQEP